MASPYKNMAECARMWFQMARGRAIVRKNYMAKARGEKRANAASTLIAFYVRVARRANKDWRRYRSHYLECQQEGI